MAALTNYETPLKRSGTKGRFRDASGIGRVGDGALDVVDQRTTDLLVEVAGLAGSRARKDERSTLLPRDVSEAFDEALSRGEQRVPPEPQQFFEALQKMNTDQVVEVIRIVIDRVQEQKRG